MHTCAKEHTYTLYGTSLKSSTRRVNLRSRRGGGESLDNARMKRRRPTAELPAELVAFILHGHVGISTYVAARQVCKTWASACFDEQLLIAVAAYTDEVTRTQLRGLLRLTQWQAERLPHAKEFKAHRQELCLYTCRTFTRALRENGGITTISDRPRYRRWSRKDNTWWEYGQDLWPTDRRAVLSGKSLRPHQHEELLHRLKVCRDAVKQAQKLPIAALGLVGS